MAAVTLLHMVAALALDLETAVRLQVVAAPALQAAAVALPVHQMAVAFVFLMKSAALLLFFVFFCGDFLILSNSIVIFIWKIIIIIKN